MATFITCSHRHQGQFYQYLQTVCIQMVILSSNKAEVGVKTDENSPNVAVQPVKRPPFVPNPYCLITSFACVPALVASK